MATDEEYMNFLNKANQDPSEGYAKPALQSKQEFKTLDAGTSVPAAIEKLLEKDLVYTSDADEPFIPVVLNWDEGGNGLPDEGLLLFPFIFCSRSHFLPRGFALGELNLDFAPQPCCDPFLRWFLP
jgi:hypothetical protein